ncbi:phage tail sheath C-terminal domain-containing protein [Kitasatospora sp. NPDC058048]|uniref:phage tail sheath family protein n=1 Tax=Kitasatospora sp. NPDC058048 TaxID=3346313 RepID=UPI0036D7C5FE
MSSATPPGITYTELSSGSHPIVPTGTSTAAFLGPTPYGTPLAPVRIRSLEQLREAFFKKDGVDFITLMTDLEAAIVALTEASRNVHEEIDTEHRKDLAETCSAQHAELAKIKNDVEPADAFQPALNAIEELEVEATAGDPKFHALADRSKLKSTFDAITGKPGILKQKDAILKNIESAASKVDEDFDKKSRDIVAAEAKSRLAALKSTYSAGAEEYVALMLLSLAYLQKVASDNEPLADPLMNLRTSVAVLGDEKTMLATITGFFDNSGNECVIVPVKGDSAADLAKNFKAGLAALEAVPDVAIVAAPQIVLGRAGITTSPQDLAEHCLKMANRVGVLSLDRSVSAAPAPGVSSPFLAVYRPWVYVPDPSGAAQPLAVPPVGHVAGVYARVDGTRGVFKAPANEVLNGVLGLCDDGCPTDEGKLNAAGINCLRTLPDRGPVVWGARTLAGSTQASDWLYISVRRLMCFLEDSITTGTAWAVFEPNDERLWSALRRNIGAFLTEQWRHGALKGTTPAEAYYVQCDETTNPDDQIRQGILTCHIGVAPVRPAEFLRLTIQQLAPQPATT